MKNYLIYLLFFLSVCSYSQQRGNRPTNSGQRSNVQQQPYDAAKASGILQYDIKKILKSLKLESEMESEFAEIVGNYNTEVDSIKGSKDELFTELNSVINQKRKEVRMTGKFNELREMQGNIRPLLQPVRNSTAAAEQKMNGRLNGLLSPEKFKKWVEIQKKAKAKLRPQAAANRNRDNSGTRRRRN